MRSPQADVAAGRDDGADGSGPALDHRGQRLLAVQLDDPCPHARPPRLQLVQRHQALGYSVDLRAEAADHAPGGDAARQVGPLDGHQQGRLAAIGIAQNVRLRDAQRIHQRGRVQRVLHIEVGGKLARLGLGAAVAAQVGGDHAVELAKEVDLSAQVSTRCACVAVQQQHGVSLAGILVPQVLFADNSERHRRSPF